MVLENGGRIFAVGELYGPMVCEHCDGDVMCRAEAWSFLLTDEENKLLPEESGPKAVTFIFAEGLGVALCDKHLPTK